MSHRMPPEDKDPALGFLGLMLVLMGVLFGTWWIVLEVVT